MAAELGHAAVCYLLRHSDMQLIKPVRANIKERVGCQYMKKKPTFQIS